ncbi:MAG: NAD(P)H-binding protein [Hyphomonadaceae bacterium]|nr:NAD(P)H-binding protein [Hyphomonadaceae bacterium]
MRMLVVGANRPLGVEIALGLRMRGHEVLATRRTPSKHDDTLARAGVSLGALDLTDPDAVGAMAAKVEAAVLTPILSISSQAVRVMAEAGLRRGVVFSSNNVAIVGADPVYDSLRAAESEILSIAPDWAILRPTMIYGHPGDRNLSRLLSFAARWPVLPRPGSGQAIQQPIHLVDLARLAAALADGAWPANGILPVGGPDRLTHSQLMRCAADAVRPGRVFLPVPLAPGRWLAKGLKAVGLPSPLSPAQFARVELDKAAVNPASIPLTLQPRISLQEGLALLAAEMGLTPPG